MPTYDPTKFYLGASGSEQPISANDNSVSTNGEDIAVDNRLAGGALVRYKVAKIYHWAFNYKWIYARTEDQFDHGMGRNAINALWEADAEMNFRVPRDGALHQVYSVRFALQSYRDQLIFRAGDIWAYRLMFELVQTD